MTPLLNKILFVSGGLAIWFFTQKLIGARPSPGQEIVDRVHTWTERVHKYLLKNESASRTLLITSSAGIDLLGVFLILSTLWGPSFRPFLGLIIIFALRQVNQAITSLPAPRTMIWRDPGVPSLLVTYGVSNDLFFSGHTAIAVYGAYELFQTGSIPLMIIGGVLALYEIIVVLLLRAHWTMDVFTGAVTALWAAGIATAIAPRVDAWF